jgi:hypothetical protein
LHKQASQGVDGTDKLIKKCTSKPAMSEYFALHGKTNQEVHCKIKEPVLNNFLALVRLSENAVYRNWQHWQASSVISIGK